MFATPWSKRLMAAAVAAAALAAGLGFLLAAAYMALAEAYSPAIAALILGLFLSLIAALIALTTTWAAARRRQETLAALPASQAELAGTALEADAFAGMGQQLGMVLRNLNPVTIVLIAAGLFVGLTRRN